MQTVGLADRTFSIGGEQLSVIAGLNVLEDAGLALEVAHELRSLCSQLDLPFAFKASFDKANRSSIHSYRGPGLDAGLRVLESVKSKLDLPIVTDIHEVEQAARVAEVADILQIPAFLCRQTDLVVAATKAVCAHDKLLHIKKAQFLAPWDCQNILTKIYEVTDKRDFVILCERGSSFGYNNLVVDLLGIAEMQKLGVPVTMDATHAVQLPGSGVGVGGEKSATGGRRYGVSLLAKAAVAAGVDGVFLEFHPNPEQAKCDGPSCLPLAEAEALLSQLKGIREVL